MLQDVGASKRVLLCQGLLPLATVERPPNPLSLPLPTVALPAQNQLSSQECLFLQVPEGHVFPIVDWQCGPPSTLLPNAIQGQSEGARPPPGPGNGCRLPPRQLELSACSAVFPTLRDASLGTPAPPHPCLAGPRAPGMRLKILSPGATDSCLSGCGRRPVFRPLIPANSG